MPKSRKRPVAAAEDVEILPETLSPGALWQPVVGSETMGLIEGLGLPEASGRRVQDEAIRVLSKCIPPGQEMGSETGLVIGYVQSGKTLSFTTVAALARDNGFQMVIVIAGTSVTLLNQSTERLIADLRLNSRRDRKWQRFINPGPDGSDPINIQNTLADWDDPAVPTAECRTVLITVMKHSTHLDNLGKVLEGLKMTGRPVIVIDDEADQAGLNTAVRKGNESPTYKKVVRLRKALPHHTFLQYTATPQAPLLINLIDVLSPRFTELLTPGDEYTGGPEFFVETPGLVRTIPDTDVPSNTNVLFSPPESLLTALRLFFLGVAAGLVNDGGLGNRSMLVHPSRGRDDHQQYAGWVRAVALNWGELLGLREGDPDRVECEEEWRDAYSDLQETVVDLPELNDLLLHLRRAIRQTKIEEVNTRAGETPQIDWSAAYPHILVGGQAMDRGFTVAGLTVTYMPRGIGVGNADTIQQRARFFGYKRPYLGYCRVFLENGARDAFKSYVVHEEDVRARLQAHNEAGKPLVQWKREFFLTPQLKPTRRGVLGLDYMRQSYGDEWWNPTMPHDPDGGDALEANRGVVKQFVKSLTLTPDPGSKQRSPIMRHGCDDQVRLSDALERLLTPYSVTDPEDSQRYTALLILITSYVEEHPEAMCSVYLMSNGLERKRTLTDEGKIENLFQGAHPDTRGAIYPGDRKVRRAQGLTIQIHTLVLEDGQDEIKDVPTLALWIPGEMATDLVVQNQPVSS